MNDEARCIETSTPAMKPPARPQPRPASTATVVLDPDEDISLTATTAVTATTPVNDRSNSPTISTTVRPAARITIGADRSRIDFTLSHLGNTSGDSSENNTNIATNPTRVTYLISCRCASENSNGSARDRDPGGPAAVCTGVWLMASAPGVLLRPLLQVGREDLVDGVALVAVADLLLQVVAVDDVVGELVLLQRVGIDRRLLLEEVDELVERDGPRLGQVDVGDRLQRRLVAQVLHVVGRREVGVQLGVAVLGADRRDRRLGHVVEHRVHGVDVRVRGEHVAQRLLGVDHRVAEVDVLLGGEGRLREDLVERLVALDARDGQVGLEVADLRVGLLLLDVLGQLLAHQRLVLLELGR